MPSEETQSGTCLKSCLYVIVISSALTVIVYCFILSHLQTIAKVEHMQTEMKIIASEVSKITQIALNYKMHRKSSTVTNDKYYDQEDVQKQMDHILKALSLTKEELKNLKDTIQFQSQLQIEPIDYASNAIGGSIESIGNTKMIGNFYSFLFKYQSQQPPSLLIQPTQLPGECFAFHGQSGEVIIRLQRRLFIDAVSIYHVSEEMSPTGKIDTAPRQFNMYGVNNRDDLSGPYNEKSQAHFLGTYQYRIEHRERLQTFQVPSDLISKESHTFVHVKFLTNHGNVEYTCVYQVRIHGKIDHTYGSMYDLH